MKPIRITTELVINRCYGGYGLSKAAEDELARRKNITIAEKHGVRYVAGTEYISLDECIPRDDPDLIDVVKTMGAAANGDSADLAVVTIETVIDIETHDGRETPVVYGR